MFNEFVKIKTNTQFHVYHQIMLCNIQLRVWKKTPIWRSANGKHLRSVLFYFLFWHFFAGSGMFYFGCNCTGSLSRWSNDTVSLCAACRYLSAVHHQDSQYICQKKKNKKGKVERSLWPCLKQSQIPFSKLLNRFSYSFVFSYILSQSLVATKKVTFWKQLDMMSDLFIELHHFPRAFQFLWTKLRTVNL